MEESQKIDGIEIEALYRAAVSPTNPKPTTFEKGAQVVTGLLEAGFYLTISGGAEILTAPGIPEPWGVGELPEYAGGRTSGILNTGRVELELTSGELGGPPAFPMPGRNNTNMFHVEAHAEQIMRMEGLDEATLWINRVPCGVKPGCANNLPRMLPQGARLRVIGPDGYDVTFTGLPDPPRYPQ